MTDSRRKNNALQALLLTLLLASLALFAGCSKEKTSDAVAGDTHATTMAADTSEDAADSKEPCCDKAEGEECTEACRRKMKRAHKGADADAKKPCCDKADGKECQKPCCKGKEKCQKGAKDADAKKPCCDKADGEECQKECCKGKEGCDKSKDGETSEAVL